MTRNSFVNLLMVLGVAATASCSWFRSEATLPLAIEGSKKNSPETILAIQKLGALAILDERDLSGFEVLYVLFNRSDPPPEFLASLKTQGVVFKPSSEYRPPQRGAAKLHVTVHWGGHPSVLPSVMAMIGNRGFATSAKWSRGKWRLIRPRGVVISNGVGY